MSNAVELTADEATFPNDAGYDELVLVRDIPFHSLCQHHLLPFSGVAPVAYLPGTRCDDPRTRAELLDLTGVRR